MKPTISLEEVKEPPVFTEVPPVFLTDETMEVRKRKLLQRMKEEQIDTVVIYADKEHGSNFEYLTGFIPRFEEGLLVLDKEGTAALILGNENLKLCKHSRITAELFHYPLFSLPNQPMEQERALEEIFKELQLDKKKKVGLIGWKMFTAKMKAPSQLFDVPYFIVDALKNTLSEGELVNSVYLLIGENGARTTNNANELAHYEYGANLSSRSMLKAMNHIAPGVREIEIGQLLSGEGQYHSVVTIAATGQRFEHANMYPTYKKIKQGDPLSMTTGFKGGLSSRTGFVVENQEQLPEEQKDYLERVAQPYYGAVVTWLEQIKIGLRGKEMYQLIEDVLPKKDYHWHLNPGHLTADEEWMSSPIYPNSEEQLQSGMIFQVDIIPSVPGYAGVSAEECVALADEQLRTEIQTEYPELWERITTRRAYLSKELSLALPDEVLPLSNTVGYLRPFYLAKNKALKVKR
ncbi:peptidase, M24 family [Enterococcus faecalis 13-SD-W-01]|nr:peptidase, M24 family [Enterococcus faecalis 13-SD-W-01]